MTEQKIINIDKYPDHMEIDLGGTGQRGKVYFDSSDTKDAKERLDNYFKIAAHKDKLLEDRKLKSTEDDTDA